MSAQLFSSKPKLRAYFKEKINTFLSLEQKESLDHLVNENIQLLIKQLFPNGFSLIGGYKAITGEPLLNIPNNWTLSYPVTLSDSQMEFYLSPESKFEEGNFGVLQPQKLRQNMKRVDDHDAFLIPAVGFSQDGYRLGHGRGYYDRYLSKYKKLKIGVGYSAQFVDNLWLEEEYDIRLDFIVTEKYIVKVRQS